MKAPLAAICLSTVLLCGCASMNWERWLGGETVNFTKCTIEDSETNRVVVAQITRLFADRCGLLEVTEGERARLESEPVHMKGYYIVAKYRGPAADKHSKDITLCAYTWEGKLITSLAQLKWRIKRTPTYLQIQDALASEFRARFGMQSDIKLYDEGPK